MAIVPITTDASLYLNAKNALESSQQTNGSWLNVKGISDVYVTALALRALYLTANTKLPSLPTQGTFTGKITNASTALPIESATVKMSNGVITKTITTSKDGRFTFNNVEPSKYQFTYSSPSLSVETQTASVQAGQQVDLGTTTLSVTPVNGVIQGTVVDAITKQALSGVSIQISGTTTVNTVTDSAGQYSVQVSPGSVALTASLQNYIDSTATASLQAGQVVNFSPSLFTTLPNDTTVTLSGSLIDATNNTAITNGVITITGSSNVQADSDGNGQFTFTGLTAGSMTLSVTAQGYNTVSVSLIATEGAQSNIGDIQLTPLPTTGTVKGIVIDAATNLPLAGVNIQIAGTTTVGTLTDSNGQYSVSIEPGDISITTSLTDYLSTTATASVIAGQVLTFSPSLSKTPPIDTTITLTGRIVDVKDNSAIANATLILSGSANQQTTSDTNGQFTFTGLTAGTITLSITATNYYTEVNIYILAGGNNISLGDVLMRTIAPSLGSTVSGYVYDVNSGSPISGAEINLFGTGRTVISDNAGFYSMPSISELDFVLSISATGYLSKTTSVNLVEPTSTKIDINLEPAVTNGFSILDLRTVKPDYRSHEYIDVTIVLDNKSTEEKQVKALLELRNANNELVQNLSVTNGINNNVEGGNVSHTVLSGTELPLISQWFTSSYPPGTYQLYLKVFDVITNVLLAERQATLIVNPTEEIETLTLKATPKFASVGEEVQLTLSADFLNKSNVDTSLSLSYDFKDINGVSIQSGQSNHVIEVSKTQGDFNIITFPYTFPDSGDYQVSVTLLSGSVVTSDMEKVISVAPSVRVEASQSIRPQVVVPDGDKRIKIRIQLKGVEAK